MSTEVDWVLAQLQSVVNAQPADHPLKRVDRDESKILKGSIQTQTAELQSANYVGATLADIASDPIGTEYDHDREAVVGVRIEGLDHSEYGHIDPGGSNGVPFDDLVHDIREAILSGRAFPDAGRTGVSYTHLELQNEAPQSSNYADYYRYDADVVFHGYEELP